MKSPLSIVVLISGSGSNLQAIIDEISNGNVNARISAVISNKPSAYGLERAEKLGIPTELIDHTAFSTREAFDCKLSDAIDRYSPDLLVLAGFMRILTNDFVRHYLGRMINIHPSLLPAYKGINTHKRALQDGVTEHGVSVHFVTPELDGGPVIIQAYVPVEEGDVPESLAQRVLVQEHIIYPLVIDWFSNGRLTLENDAVIFDGVALSNPIEHRNSETQF